MQTDTDLLLLCWNRKPRLRAALVLPLVLCGLGVRVSPHRALGAPSPRCTWWRPRYAQKNLVRACASSPEISRGGHGILPRPRWAGSGSEPRGPGSRGPQPPTHPLAHRGAWRRRAERGSSALCTALTWGHGDGAHGALWQVAHGTRHTPRSAECGGGGAGAGAYSSARF